MDGFWWFDGLEGFWCSYWWFFWGGVVGGFLGVDFWCRCWWFLRWPSVGGVVGGFLGGFGIILGVVFGVMRREVFWVAKRPNQLRVLGMAFLSERRC